MPQSSTRTADGALTVLGGGPAGLAAAFYLSRSGVPTVVLEAEKRPGGMCRTRRWGEHAYDTGAHRFHDQDEESTRDLRALLGNALREVNGPSQIYLDGRFVDFPPTPISMLMSSGFLSSARLAVEVVRARRRRRDERTFADFAVNRFGETIARRFLIGYSEKLWGCPAEELAPDVATRRLNGMTLRSVAFELLRPRAKANHLDGSFLYPRGGYGRIIDALAETLPDRALRTEHRVVGLTVKNDRIDSVELAGRPPFKVSRRILSTLPLTLLVRLLADRLPRPALEAAQRLRFRHLRLIFLRLAQPAVSPNASLYLSDPTVAATRLYEPRNRCRSMAPPGETGLVVEVPCFAGDEIFRQDETELGDRIVAELATIEILEPTKVTGRRFHNVPNAYPVYDLGFRAAVATIREALARFENLDLLGRAGCFNYSHLHDQLAAARDYSGSLA